MNINKTLKITQKIIRIFKVLLVLSIVVYTLLILYSGNIDTTQTAATSINLGAIELNLRQTFQDSILSPALLFITLFIMISLLILWYLMLSKLDIIIANAISGQIFSPTSGRSLKMISVYVIIEGVINLITRFISSNTISKYIFNLEFFNTDIVSSVTVKTDYDISFLITAFIIFILARIFAYGEELQKLSDETL
ncbi:MAG: hypothetical protein SO412_04775 [Erysipelotrichaceae bacterium]|nr:hypothetical protein [Erysipelotrichaceae bacterium]